MELIIVILILCCALLLQRSVLWKIKAKTDFTTNTRNYRALSLYLKSNRRRKISGVCLLLDIKKFALINTQHSYSTGDQVLLALAQKVQRIFNSKHDLFFRYRFGDEFLIISKGSTTDECSYKLDTLRRDLSENPISVDNSFFPISITTAIEQINDITRTGDTRVFLRLEKRVDQAKLT